MEKLVVFTTLALLGAFWNGGSVHADPRDFTLDYDASPNGGESLNFPVPELLEPNIPQAWSTFFAQFPVLKKIDLAASLVGKLALNQNESDPMVPASVQKMVTAAAAFRNLGADAKFENYFEAQVNNGVASQIKFTVSGDPTWGHPEYESTHARMDRLISALKAKGIQQVKGSITIVTTRPELDQVSRPTGWPTRWTMECMATMPSTFMMNGNCGAFRVLSQTRADWVTAGVDLPMQVSLSTGSANHFNISPEQDSLKRTVGYHVSGTFHQPQTMSSVPVYFGTRWLKNLFVSALSQNGIAYSESEGASNGTAMLVDLSSMPLKDVLQTAVQDSVNGILDRTYFEIAHQKNLAHPNDASYAVLREVVNDESLMNGVVIQDGCGLVVDDRMRADTLRMFLANLRNQPYFKDFLSVLSVAGKSGTLRNRLTGPLTNGKVFGKTGTINQFYNLAGYFQTPADTLEPFVLFTSSSQSVYAVRNLLDATVTQFAKFNP